MDKPAPMNFDYLRLLLAATVMVWHVGFLEGPRPAWWNPELAVLCFFCISGFLITQSFLRSPNLETYARKRLARIYPPIALTVLALATFGALDGAGQSFFGGVFGLLLFQDWLPLAALGDQFSFYAHGAFWTLVIEFQFYLIAPIIIGTWRKWPRLLVCALLLLAVAGYFYGQSIPSTIPGLAMRQNIFGYGHYFAAGTIAALYYRHIPTSSRFWVPACAAALAMFLYLRLSGSSYIAILMPIALMTLILGIAKACGLLGKTAPWGDLSYGIYIYHFPALTVLTAIGWDSPTKVVLTTLIMAFFSWHLVELPILRRAGTPRRADEESAFVANPSYPGA